MAKKSTLERPPKTEEDRVKYWLKELEDSLKREENYRKEAEKLIKLYEAEEDGEVPYNILYSNTETLAPALYNSAPKPDTRPRSRARNPVADAAAGLVDAQLTTFIDSGDVRHQSFDSAVTGAVLQALVPGRGVIRFHYKAEVERDAADNPTRVTDESVFPEVVDWDRIRFGYAKTWSGMPWIAFEHFFSEEEAVAEFGEAIAGTLTYTRGESEPGKSTEESGAISTAHLFEIWYRNERKVCWLEDCAKDTFVKEMDDPYRLEGFYPIPEPLQFFARVSCFIPVPLYRLYKKQAEELNKITRRIDKLIDGMKIRGFYDGQVEGLAKIFESDENTLIALPNLASLGQGAKAENAIWLVPIEKHITVLQQLIVHRQQIKTVIFEIMGIADIMRGASVASETLGAQELKNKWGTLRLKRGQKAVADFVRGCLRLAAELSFTRLAPETIRQMTGSTLPRQTQLDQLEAQVEMTGQPPAPEQQQLMAMPSFEEALALCQNDILRRYTIDIETNSTIDADASADREDMGQFLVALGQFLNGLMPLLQAGFLPAEVLKGILVTMAKRFRLGRDLDPYLAQMGQGQAQQGQAAVAQKEKALEAKGKELAKAQQDIQRATEKLQKDKAALEQRSMQQSLAEAQASVQSAIRELQSGLKNDKAKAGLEAVLLKIQTASAQLAAQKAVDAAEDRAEGEAEGQRETSNAAV
jgi:hypothetical protein